MTRIALVQICFGISLKVLLADWLAMHIGTLKNNLESLSTTDSLFLVFGFSFQIYFDFFGYSLIAIGLGRMFGIILPDNFRQPYHAMNPRDFWRRWHMSLSFWLRDYIYLPLGGNQRYLVNIVAVFFICGIWHGAGWNFVFWGLLHAALVIAYHYCATLWDRLPAILQRSGTFTLVSFVWLPFFLDLQQIGLVARGLGSASIGHMLLPADALLALAFAALACFFLTYERVSRWIEAAAMLRFQSGLVIGLLMVLSLLYMDRTATFIYFRF